MSGPGASKLPEKLVDTILAVQRDSVVLEDSAAAFKRLTRSITELTGSTYGYLGECVEDGSGEMLLSVHDVICEGMSRDEVASLSETNAPGLKVSELKQSLADVLESKKARLSHASDRLEKGRLAPGLDDGASWAAYPLAPGGELMGLLVIANRPDGYDLDLMRSMVPLVRVAGHTLMALRQRRARQAMERSQAFHRDLYDSLLTHSLDCIISMNSQGRITEWNPAAETTFGWSRDEVIGRLLSDCIVPSGLREAHAKGLAHYLRTGEGPVIDQRIEVPAIRKDGTEFPVELAIMASVLDEGTLFTAHLRDVTAERAFKTAIQEAKDAAEASNKAKTSFVATISHEIRTPINAIMGAMGLLESVEMDSRNRAILETAKHSAEALLSLVNDVLDFSRIEAGKMDIELTPVMVSELCDGVVQLLANRAISGRTKLACVLHEGALGSVMLDSGKVRQVLLNLVGNALKFSEEGNVRLDVRRADAHLKFEVTDTGVGISEAEQNELFQEFVQLGTRRVSGGTGLGLNISKRLVEFMGGEIGVKSAPGQGSTFWFTLPCTNDGVEETASEIKGRTILLIGEGSFYINAMKDQLKALGVSVRMARDLSRAREILYPGSPVSLVVLPFEPDSAEYGMASVQAIARDCKNAQVPVLAISNAAFSAEELLNFRLGVAAVIAPPLLHEDVIATISSANSIPGEVERTWSMRMDMSTGNKKFIRVLLAEDSQANRLVMSELLRRDGYEVDVVGDGMEAVTAVKSLPYDVVLMDVDMPVMDGMEATRAIRKLEGEVARVPVIALTAHVVTGTRERVLESGMDDYLSKPVDKVLMAQKIDQWAAKSKRSATQVVDNLVDTAVLQQLALDTSEELVPQMLKVFIRELAMRNDRIADSIKQKDLGALAREAHALKSSAATFGAAAIAEHARKLDDASRSGEELVALDSAKQVLSMIEPTIASLKRRMSD